MNEYFIKSKNGKINVIEGINIIDIKAIILHVHGIGSHFQFTFSNLDDFSEQDNYMSKFNYKSIGFEFHGHGKSDGLRGYVKDFNDLIDDLNTVILHINNNFINKPIYLFAESMGAAVCLKHIIDHHNESIKGLILISPMCGIDDHLKPSPLVTNILLQASNIMIFPSSESEIDLLVDEYNPPHTTQKEFYNLVKHATKERFNFLHIATRVPPELRFRKNLSVILTINR